VGPYGGSPAAVPGTIQAEDFDNGGEGVAYHDADGTNQGGAHRQTAVDLENASGGGYDVGWFGAGEWLNYTINVASAGTYTVQLRVALPNGGRAHVGFNTSSNVWQAVTVPSTGGWQNWTTVSFTATLGAGTQQMTVLSDTGGFNFDSTTIAAGGSATQPVSNPPPPSTTGTLLPVIEWNIQIDDNSETHARQTMDQLMAQGPQAEVVVIVEAYLGHLGVYIDELQKQTGKTWYGVFGTECAPGYWNGSSCTSQWYQGAAILSRYPITSNSVKYFPYQDCWSSARVGLRAALDVNGTPLQVFAMHLQTGGCQNDATSRYNSMRDFKSWASGYSAPQHVAGDFNADPDQIDTTQGMSPNFTDSWSAVGGSAFRFTALGSNPTMKLDYWFSDTSGRALPVDSRVITATGSMSDHFPLHTTFLVK
jgi:endonuclease/exonuclease/phosphatase family metal-dependent hydrolase